MYYLYFSFEDWDEKMSILCKCGHTLLMHGFTLHSGVNASEVCLWVSPCISNCECKGFEPV